MIRILEQRFALLGAAGMGFDAVMTATCLATAFATLLMAWSPSP